MRTLIALTLLFIVPRPIETDRNITGTYEWWDWTETINICQVKQEGNSVTFRFSVGRTWSVGKGDLRHVRDEDGRFTYKEAVMYIEWYRINDQGKEEKEMVNLVWQRVQLFIIRKNGDLHAPYRFSKEFDHYKKVK